MVQNLLRAHAIAEVRCVLIDHLSPLNLIPEYSSIDAPDGHRLRGAYRATRTNATPGRLYVSSWCFNRRSTRGLDKLTFPPRGCLTLTFLQPEDTMQSGFWYLIRPPAPTPLQSASSRMSGHLGRNSMSHRCPLSRVKNVAFDWSDLMPSLAY